MPGWDQPEMENNLFRGTYATEKYISRRPIGCSVEQISVAQFIFDSMVRTVTTNDSRGQIANIIGPMINSFILFLWGTRATAMRLSPVDPIFYGIHTAIRLPLHVCRLYRFLSVEEKKRVA